MDEMIIINMMMDDGFFILIMDDNDELLICLVRAYVSTNAEESTMPQAPGHRNPIAFAFAFAFDVAIIAFYCIPHNSYFLLTMTIPVSFKNVNVPECTWYLGTESASFLHT